MSRLDDIDARINAKMAEIMRRIDGGNTPASVQDSAPRPFAQMPASPESRILSATASALSDDPTLPPSDDVSFQPQDGSSQPTLGVADLNALAPFDISVVGLNPGDVYTPEGTRNPDDSGPSVDEIIEKVVAAARKANIKLGSCDVHFIGAKGKLTKRFIGPTLYCRDVPETPTTAEELVLLNVAKAVAYFHRRWRFTGFSDICILWAEVDAVMDSSFNVKGLEYCDNAFSLERDAGRTFLCFSPEGDNMGLDTTSHEFTHSVSGQRIGWGKIYKGENGALNESFSDIFAKFAEWAWNGRQPFDRNRWVYAGIRDMAHPEQIPQRFSKVQRGDKQVYLFWIAPSYYLQGVSSGNHPPPEYADRDDIVGYGWYAGDYDRGGVHYNNSVIARLCFLLCEGEAFVRDDGRSFDVRPIGFTRTEELFGTLLFGRQTYLLSNCNMYSFYNGIVDAAQDLGFSTDEQNRLQIACDAVNIIPPETSSRFGNLPLEGFSMRSAIGDVAGASRRPYTEILAEALSGELGLRAAGVGFTVEKESVVKLPDLHAAVPTGGEVQVTFSQTWKSLPVFASCAIAQISDGERITRFQNGFSSSLGQLVSQTSTDEAAARRTAEAEFPGAAVASVRKVVFDPALLMKKGQATVAWQIRLRYDDSPAGMCIVSAADGSLLHSVSSRIDD